MGTDAEALLVMIGTGESCLLGLMGAIVALGKKVNITHYVAGLGARDFWLSWRAVRAGI